MRSAIPPGTVRSRLHHAHRACAPPWKPTPRPRLEVDRMTPQRDIGKVLERWFVDGVDQMPDCVFLRSLIALNVSPSGVCGASIPGGYPPCPPRSSSSRSEQDTLTEPVDVHTVVLLPSSASAPADPPAPPPTGPIEAIDRLRPARSAVLTFIRLTPLPGEAGSRSGTHAAKAPMAPSGRGCSSGCACRPRPARSHSSPCPAAGWRGPGGRCRVQHHRRVQACTARRPRPPWPAEWRSLPPVGMFSDDTSCGSLPVYRSLESVAADPQRHRDAARDSRRPDPHRHSRRRSTRRPGCRG